MKTLIKNGTIVNVDQTLKADVLINEDKIVEIGENLLVDDAYCETIDAGGHYIFPGGIDPTFI